jgi:hypothetical protein
MTRKTIATLGILVLLLVSIVGTAAGQTGDEPTPEPVTTEETTTYSHPVVQILAKYFGREDGPLTKVVETEETPDPEATADPEATPEPTDEGEDAEEAVPMDEQIAAYHEEGMGFGVLVKLYAMAEASAQACLDEVEPEAVGATDEPGTDAPEDACTPLTVDELVEQFKGGVGMGQLFKEHGKPALLGVGHVKKELKNLETQEPETVDETLVPTEEETATEELRTAPGNGNGNRPDNSDKPGKPAKTQKPKTNNGRRP